MAHKRKEQFDLNGFIYLLNIQNKFSLIILEASKTL